VVSVGFHPARGSVAGRLPPEYNELSAVTAGVLVGIREAGRAAGTVCTTPASPWRPLGGAWWLISS